MCTEGPVRGPEKPGHTATGGKDLPKPTCSPSDMLHPLLQTPHAEMHSGELVTQICSWPLAEAVEQLHLHLG